MTDTRKKLFGKLSHIAKDAKSILPGQHKDSKKDPAHLDDEETSKKDKKSKKEKKVKPLIEEKKSKKEKKEKNKDKEAKETHVTFASDTEGTTRARSSSPAPSPTLARPAPPPVPFRANPLYVESVDLLEKVINQIEPLQEINSTVLFSEGEKAVFAGRLARLRERLEKPDEQDFISQEIQQLKTDLMGATKRAREAAKPEVETVLNKNIDDLESASSLARTTAELERDVKAFQKQPKRKQGFTLFSCCCGTAETNDDQKTLLKKESPSINRP